jgi:hypothetical protein
MTEPTLSAIAAEYARRQGILLDFQSPLGSGTDGSVWQTERMTAVKAFLRSPNYSQELNCYKRLEAAHVSRIGKFAVPELVGCSDELLVIEMTLVSPPFIIDFAKSYLDKPPDFSPEVLADEEERNREVFEDRWRDVKALLWALRQHGIYYMDPKPGQHHVRGLAAGLNGVATCRQLTQKR